MKRMVYVYRSVCIITTLAPFSSITAAVRVAVSGQRVAGSGQKYLYV